MATTLAEAISRARSRHPAFDKVRVPDKVAADFLTDCQRRLVAMATGIDRTHLVQSAAIVLAPDPVNAVGSVGAGALGGLPGTVDADGTVRAESAPAGSALGYDAAAETVVVAE